MEKYDSFVILFLKVKVNILVCIEKVFSYLEFRKVLCFLFDENICIMFVIILEYYEIFGIFFYK